MAAESPAELSELVGSSERLAELSTSIARGQAAIALAKTAGTPLLERAGDPNLDPQERQEIVAALRGLARAIDPAYDAK